MTCTTFVPTGKLQNHHFSFHRMHALLLQCILDLHSHDVMCRVVASTIDNAVPRTGCYGRLIDLDLHCWYM